MQEIIAEIQNKFGSEIIRQLERKHFALSPDVLLSNSFNLLHFSNELIGVIPEIICGYVAGGKYREEVILKNAESCFSLKDRKHLLLCHALSPYSESIGFYCDLGRAYRFSKGLGLKLQIMLAGKQWATYNWVVMDLKLKNNLSKNEEWRINVYKTLFDDGLDVLSIDDVEKDYKVDVHAQANDYVNLVIKMFGNEVTKKEKLTDDEVEKLLSDTNIIFELAKLGILRNEIQPIKTTIECVMRNFKRVDEETFVYFLTQYYHQSRYNGSIKISMKREKDFDDSFREIYKVLSNPKVTHDDLIGVYLEDYKYGHMDNLQVTAHPYYFPSGTLYGMCKRNIKKAVSNCIMIGDYSDKAKIKAILSKINYFQRARLLSDILSFGHLLSVKNEATKHNILRWFKKIKPDYYSNSWEIFTGRDKNFDLSQFVVNWSSLIFSPWANHKNFPIPYWFLPFFWDCNENSSGNVSIDEQSELIQIILTDANKIFGLPTLVVDPVMKSSHP